MAKVNEFLFLYKSPIGGGPASRNIKVVHPTPEVLVFGWELLEHLVFFFGGRDDYFIKLGELFTILLFKDHFFDVFHFWVAGLELRCVRFFTFFFVFDFLKDLTVYVFELTKDVVVKLKLMDKFSSFLLKNLDCSVLSGD